MALAPRTAQEIKAFLEEKKHRVHSDDPGIRRGRKKIINKMEKDIKKMCEKCVRHVYVPNRKMGSKLCEPCFKDYVVQSKATRAEDIEMSDITDAEKVERLMALWRQFQKPESRFAIKTNKEDRLREWIETEYVKKQGGGRVDDEYDTDDEKKDEENEGDDEDSDSDDEDPEPPGNLDDAYDPEADLKARGEDKHPELAEEEEEEENEIEIVPQHIGVRRSRLILSDDEEEPPSKKPRWRGG